MKSTSDIKVHQVLELEVSKLSSSGDGIARIDDHHPIIFIPDTVPGDRIQARITVLKKNFAKATLQKVLEASPHRIRPACIVADKCGGCQWLAVDYAHQLETKKDLIYQALKRIGKFDDPLVKSVIGASNPMAYRNKVSYPLGLSGDGHKVTAGYFQKNSHKLINLNQCPIQDEAFNPLLKDIKQELQDLGIPIYNESKHEGILRHLCFRVGRRTGQIMITLVVTTPELPELQIAAMAWLERYEALISVNININPDRTNRIFGSKTKNLAGQPHIKETFMGLNYSLKPTTFFQVFTEQAEAIATLMIDTLKLSGTESVIDAYCGVGTLTLPLAQQTESVLGIESAPQSIRQAKENARINQIRNTRFKVGKVEDILSEIDLSPDVMVLDPPRKGCNGAVIDSIKRLRPSQVMYLSCNPATLARDLDLLVHQGPYQMNWVQPADFFPQTSHVEALAYLTL